MFPPVFDIATQYDMQVFVTMDTFSTTPGLNGELLENNTSVDDFLADVLRTFFSTYNNVTGIIVRIGESDGLDVEDDFKSQLHIKNARQLNALDYS